MDAATAGRAASSGGSPAPGKETQGAISSGKVKNYTNGRRNRRRKSPSPGTISDAQRQRTPGASSAQSKKPHKNSPFNTIMDPPFEEYWDRETVQRGLKQKELIQGVLRINQKNYTDAYMDDPEGRGDYYINGMQRRNRALEGDVVVLQVLPTDQWLDEERMLLSSESQNHPTLQDFSPALNTLQQTSAVVSGEPEETQSSDTQESNPPPLATLIERLYTIPDDMKVGREGGEEEEEDESTAGANRRYKQEVMKYRRTAKVVYIVEKVHSRTIAGYLRSYDKNKGLVLMSPKDSKVPRLFVPLSSCPPEYDRNMKKYENTLFIGRIKSWDLNCSIATGDLMRSVGEAGEIEPETESFLIENEVEFGEFSPQALDCLPKQSPWTIPEAEVSQRRDFRKECVFTIDPETARDLDDAIHVKELEKDVYEVGVHIADVSYFVKAGTALDQEASSRATSVYLVQRVIPMLPRLLCEKLCSLNPNEERLTVSVVWTLTSDGECKDEWMGRSIIKSCAQLSYSHAQDMIDDPSRVWKVEELPEITNGFTAKNISWAVDKLNKLANGLRRQRESKGTLRLNQPKLRFTIDKETGLPSGCDVYKQKESNRLIEELMLLANMAVARKIWKAFPDRAMLRRHPAPKEKSAQHLAYQCMELGIPMDVSTAASIQSCLDGYQGTSEDEEVNTMQKMFLVSNCSKIMELARYFSSGAVEKEVDFRHYALNVPRYTHFTSPIRRYADIVVHRQLIHSLKKGEEFTLLSEEVESQAHHCNKKKKAAKTVQELSLLMFFAIFIRESGSVRAKGIIVQVLDKAFDVLIQHYGVIKRIYCEQMELEKFEACRHKKYKSKISGLTLIWPGTTAAGSLLRQELKVMLVVEIELTSGPKPLQFVATLLPPST